MMHKRLYINANDSAQMSRGCFTLAHAFLVVLLGIASPLSAASLKVTGWPHSGFAGKEPDWTLGDDPVVGRQVCPPLTRLNLVHGKSEGLVVRRVVDESDARDGEVIWHYELRTGIHWWSGGQVSPTDVARFLTDNLPRMAAYRSGGVWKAENFTVSVQNSNAVHVRWKTAPDFGPYLTNDIPFYRSSEGRDGLSWECAGVFRPVMKSGEEVRLVPTGHYPGTQKVPAVVVSPGGGSPPHAGGDPQIRFLFSRDLSGGAGGGSQPGSCGLSVEMPFMTLIAWNPSMDPVKGPEFRRALSRLIPRSVIVEAGASGLGVLASGLVPRMHPGYDSRVTAPSFDLSGASRMLDALGFKRKVATSPRLNTDGQPLKLRVGTGGASTGLIEKVMADAFSAVGIDLKFVDGEESDLQGYLVTLSMDWPRVSMLSMLHSRSEGSSRYWKVHDQALDALLEKYARSLTTESPDFSRLAEIHRYMAGQELATVIFQHRACILDSGKVQLGSAGLDMRDPDWFRAILF